MRWNHKIESVTAVPLSVISSAVGFVIERLPMSVIATAQVGSRSKDPRGQTWEENDDLTRLAGLLAASVSASVRLCSHSAPGQLDWVTIGRAVTRYPGADLVLWGLNEEHLGRLQP